MNQLGMLVDLAHVGDRTSTDAAEASGQPVVISHAGARARWPSPRMKPDDVLRAVATAGGVIGVEAPPGSTRVKAGPSTTWTR
jgi:membrane dipeptidase